jgi:hypothetical protein
MMTRLSEYLHAERPDETEPASFYVPGAPDWRTARLKRTTRPSQHETGDADEEELTPNPIEETTDVQDMMESAAAQAAATLKELNS